MNKEELKEYKKCLDDPKYFNLWHRTLNKMNKVGKNQRLILQALSNHGSMFLSDLKNLSHFRDLNDIAISCSLKLLTYRGLIARKKKFNKGCRNFNKYNWKYPIGNWEDIF